jgi:glutathione synthase/RimK-type ligase-like ATP-grasp enzyme
VILVVSPPDDDHAGAVADLLGESGRETVLIDVPSLSSDTAVELELDGAGTFRRRLHVAGRPGRGIDLDAATTGFWRRLHAPVVSRDVAVLAELDGAPMESTESFESVTASLDLAWINDPVRDHIARRRPRQWAAAAAVGLPVPPTLVTRDPAAAIAFRDAHLHEGVVVKQLGRRLGGPGCSVLPDEQATVGLVADAPAESVLQAFVPGADVRVIVVGGQHFAVEFGEHLEFGEQSAGLPADLVADDDAVRPTIVPRATLLAIDAMLRRLGLVAAAVDLRRDPDGVYRFLDLDPTPRWLLLEELTGWPITQAVVDALLVRDDAFGLSGRSGARR